MARPVPLASGQRVRLVTATIGFAVFLVAVSLRFAGLPAARATGESLSINGRDSLGIGLQDVYRLVLSDPAPPGGLAVTIDSNDDTCVVARTENSTGDASAIVLTIPYRQKRASFVVQSVETPVSGTCSVSATATDWTPGGAQIAMVQPALRIRDFRGTYGALSMDDPFFVEVGVPGNNGGLRFVQGVSKQLAADPLVEVCSGSANVGAIVDVFGIDNGGDLCEEAPIFAPFSRTVPGNLKFDPNDAAADDPNDPNDLTTTVTASSVGFADDDERTATVRELSVNIRGAELLGASLQDQYTIRLSSAAPSNTVVDVWVTDPNDCAVAVTEQSLGAASIQRTVPQNRYSATFIVQGVQSTLPEAPCEVTVDAGIFGTDKIAIDVVEPGLRLRDVPSQIAEFADNAPFFVELGVPDPAGRGLRHVQQLAKGTAATPISALEVTVRSTPKETGTIVDVAGVDNDDDGEEIVDVTPGYSRTVPGQVAFDPIAGSSDPALVEAFAPGFIEIDASKKEVLVKAATLRIRGSEELGSYLQDHYRVDLLSAGGHPATVVTVTSLDPNNCEVAASPNQLGATSIELNVAAGDSSADFVVQAAEMVTDVECELEASSPIFSDTASYTIDIVQPGIEIRGLRRNINEGAANDPFFVQVGLPAANCSGLRRTQAVRKGSTVSFQVCSQDKDIGTIVDVVNVDNGDDGCEDDVVLATFSNNVPGDLKFDPIAPGSTIVEVSAAGFKTMERSGSVEIHVGGDSLHLSLPGRIGSNLQEDASLRLSRGADVNGTEVLIESLTSDKCLVAPDSATEGQSSISVTVPEGARSIDFTVAAVIGLDEETCRVRATATGFLGDEDEARIVAPAVQISELRNALGTTSPDQIFLVEIGVPGGGGVGPAQAVRIGGAPEPVTVCSDNTEVAEIVGAGVDGCLTVNIQPGQSSATFTLHLTGIAGTAKIKASGGVDAMDMVRVHVQQTVVNPDGPNLLGKNLQTTYFARVNNNGGVEFTVDAGPSSVCVVSDDPMVLGDGLGRAFVIPSGDGRASFTIQAVEIGMCTISISGTNIPTSAIEVPVVYSRLRIRGLPNMVTIQNPGEQFVVEIGPANPRIPEVLTNKDNRRGITRPMARRVGAGALSVQVCTDPTIAQVHDPGHDDPPASLCVSDPIAEGETETQTFELHPVNDDTVEIQASAPAEPDVDATRHDVTIKPNGIIIRGPHDEIGRDLQDVYEAGFDSKPPTGTIVTVTVTDGDGDCDVAATSGAASEIDDQLEITVPDGKRKVEFWIRGVQVGDCSVHVTSDAPASGEDARVLDVVDAAVQILGLQRVYSVLHPPDRLTVEVGVATGNLRRLRYTQIVVPGGQIPFKVCSSDSDVGEILGLVIVGDCAYETFDGGQDSNEELQFLPKDEGNTLVFAEENGVDLVITDPGARRPIEVRNEVIQIRPDDRLAAGLQDEYRVVLSKSVTIDSTVTLSVPAAAQDYCAVADSAAGPFAATAQITVPENDARASFWVQGILQGECLIDPTINQTGYDGSQAAIDIVDPTLRIRDLDNAMSTQTSDDRFFVQIGAIGRRGLHMAEAQAAGAGNGAVPIEVCSSNTDVGELVGDDANGCVTVYVAEGDDRTIDGDLIFHAVGEDPNEDTTEVCASSPGYIPIKRSCRTVKVSPTVPTVNGPDLGAGLQEQYVLRTSHSMAADTTFVISVAPESLPICDVAIGEDELGVDSIELTIPAGRSREQFHILGIAGAMDACRLEIDAPAGSGVVDTIDEVAVVKPGLKIIGLDRSQASTGSNDDFSVVLGVPGGNLRTLQHEQVARNDGAGVTVTVCSSRPDVGEIVGANVVTDCRDDVFVPAGESRVPDESLYFDPKGEDPDTDLTVVTASAPGFISTALAERIVRVVTVGVNVNGPDLGAGLQEGYSLRVTKAVPEDTDFTISVATDSLGLCTVAEGEADAGQPQITVTVPAGRSKARFYVHALEMVMGVCVLEIEPEAGSGVATGVGEIEIVMPALRIIKLNTSQSTQANDDPFNVESGVPAKSLRSLVHVQAASVDGSGIPVTVCSSEPSVGTIIGAGPDGCTLVVIPPGESRTTDLDLIFHAVTEGLTTVTASSPGFISIDPSSRDVRVAASVANVNGPDLGAGLQDQYVLALSKALQNAATFDITALDTDVCRVAIDGSTASQATIQIGVAAGKSRGTFYVHGVSANTCELEVVPSAGSGVVVGVSEIQVVAGGLKIVDLNSSQSPDGNDDPFRVEVGLPGGSLSGLVIRQEARSDVPGGVLVDVCSSRPLVGTIVGADAMGCIQVAVPPGEDRTGPTTLLFDPRGLDEDYDTTTVTAEADDFISTDKASRDVRVSPFVINVNGPDLGVGLHESYVLVLSDTVGSDTVFTVSVVDDAICMVAPDDATSGSSSIPVTVLDNKSRADFFVQGFDEGTCVVLIDPPAGFGATSGLREIEVVLPALRIVHLDTSRPVNAQDDPFDVDIGLPGADRNNLERRQEVRAGDSDGVSFDVCSSDPDVGEIVGANALTGCKTVTIDAGESQVASGALEFDAQDDGVTFVSAGLDAPGFEPVANSVREVHVSGIVTNANGPDEVGARLQENYVAVLSSAPSSDTVIILSTTTADKCLLANSEMGTPDDEIPVTVPKGRTRADFWVHGVEEGACEITLTPPVGVGIAVGTRTVDIVTAGLRLIDLGSSIRTGAADDKFGVKVGIPADNLKDLKQEQDVRAGTTLTVRVCTTDVNVAEIIGTPTADPECETATIQGNEAKTADGALKLHAVGYGTVTIDADADDYGFIRVGKASKDVEVSTGSLNVDGGKDAVGAGLQDTFTININPKTPEGGLELTIASETPDVCFVSIDEDTAGSASIPITVGKGRSQQNFAVQGLDIDDCEISITTTDPNYADGSLEVAIVQPALRIRDIDQTTTGTAANDGFFIDVGVPTGSLKNLDYLQTVRQGTGGLTVEACSSAVTVAVVIGDDTARTECKSAVIPPGESGTPKNDLKLDPVYTGGGQASTTVTAEAPGHITTDKGSVDVIVAASSLTFIEGNIDKVGSGLMDTFKVQANVTQPEPKSILVTSLSPSICEVAVDEESTPADEVYVVIKAGSKTETFVIHGVEGATGPCELMASHAQFVAGFHAYDVVEPGLRLYDLTSSRSANANNDPFRVHVGLPKSNLENLQTTQRVRTGSAGLDVTVCSSDPAVGLIVANSVGAECQVAHIPAGDYKSGASAVEFDAVGDGSTVVEATAPGHITTEAGAKEVTVSGFGWSFENGGTETIGAGLQMGGFKISRSANGAVTVRVTSLTPDVCVVSTGGGTAGVEYIDLSMSSSAPYTSAFWIQGIESAQGTCEIEATSSGYTAGLGQVDIVPPGVQITGLLASMVHTAANNPFKVEVGIPNSSLSGLASLQAVRGGSAGLDITVSNGNGAAGTLVGSNSLNQTITGNVITVRINAQTSTNATSGPLQKLEFDANASLGSTAGTSVSASHPGLISTGAATKAVTVTVGSSSGGGC